jgi:uncharacterized protein YjbI with pentapeptide repeats
MARPNGRRGKPGRQIELPDLTRFEGDRLEAGHDYDSIAFVDRDFTGQDAADARFLECRLERCSIDGLSLRRVRVVQSVFSEFHGANADIANSTWRDSRISGGRLGAMVLAGATWNGVVVHGSKLGFVNLAGAKLEDVVFEECEIGSIDARAAQLRSIAFVDCTIDEFNVSGATLSKVDLSGARLRSLLGIESLRGAIVSHEQLLDLAPVLAAQLGLEVRPD